MVLIWRWIMSILFVVVNAVVMAILGIVFLPWAVLSPQGALIACKSYTYWVQFTARWLVGITWGIAWARCPARNA